MRTTQMPSRLAGVLLVFVVVTLWSSSWVLIKLGVEDIPALTFAGLRCFVALIYLPTVTTCLLFAFNTIVVALLAGALLREPPTRSHWCGVIVAMSASALTSTW